MRHARRDARGLGDRHQGRGVLPRHDPRRDRRRAPRRHGLLPRHERHLRPPQAQRRRDVLRDGHLRRRGLLPHAAADARALARADGAPSVSPTVSPTPEPTEGPTPRPTPKPTTWPTAAPTAERLPFQIRTQGTAQNGDWTDRSLNFEEPARTKIQFIQGAGYISETGCARAYPGVDFAAATSSVATKDDFLGQCGQQAQYGPFVFDFEFDVMLVEAATDAVVQILCSGCQSDGENMWTGDWTPDRAAVNASEPTTEYRIKVVEYSYGARGPLVAPDGRGRRLRPDAPADADADARADARGEQPDRGAGPRADDAADGEHALHGAPRRRRPPRAPLAERRRRLPRGGRGRDGHAPLHGRRGPEPAGHDPALPRRGRRRPRPVHGPRRQVRGRGRVHEAGRLRRLGGLQRRHADQLLRADGHPGRQQLLLRAVRLRGRAAQDAEQRVAGRHRRRRDADLRHGRLHGLRLRADARAFSLALDGRAVERQGGPDDEPDVRAHGQARGGDPLHGHRRVGHPRRQGLGVGPGRGAQDQDVPLVLVLVRGVVDVLLYGDVAGADPVDSLAQYQSVHDNTLTVKYTVPQCSEQETADPTSNYYGRCKTSGLNFPDNTGAATCGEPPCYKLRIIEYGHGLDTGGWSSTGTWDRDDLVVDIRTKHLQAPTPEPTKAPSQDGTIDCFHTALFTGTGGANQVEMNKIRKFSGYGAGTDLATTPLAPGDSIFANIEYWPLDRYSSGRGTNRDGTFHKATAKEGQLAMERRQRPGPLRLPVRRRPDREHGRRPARLRHRRPRCLRRVRGRMLNRDNTDGCPRIRRRRSPGARTTIAAWTPAVCMLWSTARSAPTT